MTSADSSDVEKPQSGCSRYCRGSKLKGAFIIQERKKKKKFEIGLLKLGVHLLCECYMSKYGVHLILPAEPLQLPISWPPHANFVVKIPAALQSLAFERSFCTCYIGGGMTMQGSTQWRAETMHHAVTTRGWMYCWCPPLFTNSIKLLEASPRKQMEWLKYQKAPFL